jgi:DNA-binding NarL/FixJ family response regulator
LVAAGLDSKAIGERLEIQPKSVSGHLDRLYDRYDVSDRTRLATLALARGWIAAADIDAVTTDSGPGTS